MDDTKHVARTRRINSRGLKVYARAFRKLGLEFVPSSANFILVRVGDGVRARGVRVAGEHEPNVAHHLRAVMCDAAERLEQRIRRPLSIEGANMEENALIRRRRARSGDDRTVEAAVQRRLGRVATRSGLATAGVAAGLG